MRKIIVYGTPNLTPSCGHTAGIHTDRCFTTNPTARNRAQAMKEQSRDRNGIALPDGWALYYDGELVFSVSPEKWETIGPAIAKIMQS